MKILQILLFFSVFSTVYACSVSNCGSFSIHYPFKLEFENPPDSCTYINLSCNIPDQLETLVVSLPYGGDFNVRYIDYHEAHIALYDPGACLMRRLMKLNISSSPFMAIDHQNYTFYTCPLSANLTSLKVLPILCLGDNTSYTVATAKISSDKFLHEGCGVFGTWKLPVLEQDHFEYEGINNDLYLRWNNLTCSDCEEGDDSKNLWGKFVRSSYFLPSFMVLASFFIIFFLEMMELITRRNVDPPTAVQLESATAPPGSTDGGLDDSKINACTELVVISESRIRIDPEADCNTCSICLESYVPQDSVRSITQCEHCFHSECIQLWLRKNRTCPVCRTVLADGAEL